MQNKSLSPKRGNQEQKLQIAVCSYVDYALPDVLAFAVPNGGKRSIIEGALMKKMGVKAGVADMLFFWKDGFGAIELKRPDKKPVMSPEQHNFANLWRDFGGKFACCNSLEGVEDTFKAWGLKPLYRVPIMEGSRRIMLQQAVMHEMYKK